MEDITVAAGHKTAEESNEIGKLACALAKAQAEMANPKKSHTAHIASKGGARYEYHYADLAEIIDAVRPALSKHEIAFVQVLRTNGKNVLSTRLIHASGQYIESLYPLADVLLDAQAMGSAITYARRYSLCAILGIAAEDDDDANAAMEAEKLAEEERKRASTARLEEMKAKGQVKSANDGKTLKPGEDAQPEKRTPAPTAPTPEKPADKSKPAIDIDLAAAMNKDGVTLDKLRAFGVEKKHFPVEMDMSKLRPELVAAYLRPDNWAKVIEFAKQKGGSK